MAGLGTGHGATLGFTGFTAPVRSMQLQNESSEKVDISHLSSGPYRDYVGADLADLEAMSGVALFDTELTYPDVGVTGTLTITFPIKDTVTNTVAATLVGSASLSQLTWPNLETNTPMEMPFSFEWLDKPVFTIEAPV